MIKDCGVKASEVQLKALKYKRGRPRAWGTGKGTPRFSHSGLQSLSKVTLCLWLQDQCPSPEIWESCWATALFSKHRKLWSFPISPHHLAVERSSLCLCWLSNKQLPLSLPCLMGTFVLWTSINCVKKHWTRIAAMKIIRKKQRLSGMALIHFDLNSAAEHQDWAQCEDLPPSLAVSSTTCSSRIRNNLHSQSNTACDSFSWLSWEATGCSRRGDGCCTLPWDPSEHQAWEATSKQPPLWQSLQQGKAWALQCHWPGVWIKQHKRQ